MARSMKALAIVPLAMLWLALASPAFADETCDPLDLTCVVRDTGGSGQEAAKNAVDTVTGAAKPIADDPQGTVDRILHPGTVIPPGDGGGGGGGGVGNGDQPHVRHTTDQPVGKGSHVAHGPQVPRSAVPRSAVPRSAGPSPDNPPIGIPSSKEPVSLDRAVHVVTQSLGVVLALLAVAVGFVMVQDRLDRRDPKLTLAPVQTEMMGFS